MDTVREIDNALAGDVRVPANTTEQALAMLLQDAAKFTGKDIANLRVLETPNSQNYKVATDQQSSILAKQQTQQANEQKLTDLLQAFQAVGAKQAANEIAVGEANVQKLQAENLLAKQKADMLSASLSQAGMNINDYGNARSDLFASLQELQRKQRDLTAKRDAENNSIVGRFFGTYTKDPNFIGKQTQQQIDVVAKDSLETSKVLEQLISGTEKLARLDQALIGKQSEDTLNAQVASARAVAQRAADVAQAKSYVDGLTQERNAINTNRSLAATESQITASINRDAREEARLNLAQEKAANSGEDTLKDAIRQEQLTVLQTKNAMNKQLLDAGIDPNRIKATDATYVSYVTQGGTITSFTQGGELFQKHDAQLRVSSPEVATSLRLWHQGANSLSQRPAIKASIEKEGLNAAKTAAERELAVNKGLDNVLYGNQMASGEEAKRDGYLFGSNIGAWLPAAGSGYDRKASPALQEAIKLNRQLPAVQQVLTYIGGGADTPMALKLTDQEVIDAVAGAAANQLTKHLSPSLTLAAKAAQLSSLYKTQVALNNELYSPTLVGLRPQDKYEVLVDNVTGEIATRNTAGISPKTHTTLDLTDKQDMYRIVLMREIQGRQNSIGGKLTSVLTFETPRPTLQQIKVPQ